MYLQLLQAMVLVDLHRTCFVEPRGIFVTVNLDLYVADSGNNRIQLFPSGQLNATTVAGNGSSYSMTLNSPTAVVLDADKNLFVSDFNNHRIVRFSSSNCQCLFGCTGGSGAGMNQLNNPHSLSFDSNGNLYVVDVGNNRIQKFLLEKNSCGKLKEGLNS